MAFWNRKPTAAPLERQLVSKSTTATSPTASTQLKDIWGEFYSKGMAIEPPLDPEAMVDLMRANEAHSACLAAKTADSVGTGYSFEPREDVEDPDPQEVAGLARRLNQLSPAMPFVDMLCQAALEMEAVGWSGWEVLRDATRQVAAIYPARAHTLRRTKEDDVFIQVRDGRTRFFVAFGSGRQIDRETGAEARTGETIAPEKLAAEMIWFSRYAPESDWYGIPMWVSTMASLAELGSIRDYNIEFFDSAGVISKLIAVKSKVSAKKIVDDIASVLKDARGKNHRSVVFELPEDGSLEVEDLAANVQDAKFQERRTNLSEAILMAHQVPPYRIGWAKQGSLGGSSAPDMLAAYNRGVIEPLQRQFEHRLSQTLFGPMGIRLAQHEFKLRNLFGEDETEMNEATKAVAGGLLSPNEGRQRIGAEPNPDPLMDRVYFNGRPLDTSGEASTAFGVVQEMRKAISVALQEPAPAVAAQEKPPAGPAPHPQLAPANSER